MGFEYKANWNVRKDTCWYDSSKVPEQMLLGAKGVLWPVLEKSDHFPVLDALIQETKDDSFSMLDIGCGAAELSRLYPEFYYTGADLPNIIKEVSMKMHPQNSYISFDIYGDNTDFIKDYDLIVMNAFIDVLEKPTAALSMVLTKSPKYVIMHRQCFNDKKKTHLYQYPSYGGAESFQSVINREEFSKILEESQFEILKELTLNYGPPPGYETSDFTKENYTRSILMRRK
jgi:hypothetical protein